jgi:predicted O-methyltransferase YrrM
MKKRALWIFDKNYLMLTYLSVSSFIDHCDVIVTLVYCGDKMDEADKNIFSGLDTKVEFFNFDVDVSSHEPHLQANILNRFARLHFTRLFENDLLFMIDSDVGFSSSLKDEILEVESQFQLDSTAIPMISGVVEFLDAKDAYLYFKTEDKNGFTMKIPIDEKDRTYHSIYGSEWQSLVDGFQFNNGFLIFYKARTLIDQWEEYYLRGLKNKNINPLDDQVPLAAAIQKTECNYWKMGRKWNSLGDLGGSFIMFHAWGGEWKIEIDQVMRNGTSTSDYGEICKKYLPTCPPTWLEKFSADLLSFPIRYRNIKGGFQHGTIFTDLMKELNEGYIVEVGTYKGRSTCFLAELIKATGKKIKFHSIDHFERDDTDIDSVKANLIRAGVESYVEVIEAHSLEASNSYESKELDFVFLDTESPADMLWDELEAWYDKVKDGGILGGYDHSIHDTVFKSYDCVIARFCEKHKLPLRTYEYQFLIKKPLESV